MAQVAVITAQAPRLAGELARHLAGGGMEVAVVGGGGGVRDGDVDLADAESVRAALAEIAESVGDPCLLVHTVAAEPPYPPTSGAAPDDWFAPVTAGLRAAFVAGRAALEALAASGGGRIVAVLDGDARETSVVRGGIEGFVRTVALELQPLEITVNLLVPAPPSGGMPGTGPGFGDDGGGGDGYAARAAAFVRLLAEPGAGAVTGQVISIG